MSSTQHGYRVPEKSILTGTLAKKIQIIGRLELELGEIGATALLVITLIILFLATSFLGWEGLPLFLRLSVIALIGWGGKMAIFDRPGGMKYADWLVMWYRYRSRKQAGQLDYTLQRSRRARLRRGARRLTEQGVEQSAMGNAPAVSVADGLERRSPDETFTAPSGGQSGRSQRWERNNSAA